MTDDQVEKLIMREIRKRDILFFDMVGLPDHGVDPNPDNKDLSRKSIRNNRFEGHEGYQRMIEILCVGKYSPYLDMPPLKVSWQDLFRFWWNRCVVQEYVIEEVLTDIFEFFTEKLWPPGEEEEKMNRDIDFEQISLFRQDLEEAA